MNKYIKYLKSLLYIFIPLLISNLVLSILYYFNILSNKTLSILNIILVLLSMFIGGLYIGKKSNKKGYLEGIKIGLIAIIILFIISYLAFDKGINIHKIIYYLILLSSSTIGSMLGINKKRID